MWGQIVSAVAPALLGAFANDNSSNARQGYSVNVAPAGASETYAATSIDEILKQLQGFAGAGPGQQDVANAYGAQQSLAQMLQQYSQGNYAPTQQDFEMAKNQTALQQEQINQYGKQANTNFQRQAAISGRGPMDFAFTNKLNQQLGDMQAALAAQQTQIAQQQPNQRLQYASDYANIQQGLATQAQQNRLAIANLGASIRDFGANTRLQTAGRTQFSNQMQGTQTSNMLQGAIAGLGSTQKVNDFFSQFNFGGGSNTGSGGAGNKGQFLGIGI